MKKYNDLDDLIVKTMTVIVSLALLIGFYNFIS